MTRASRLALLAPLAALLLLYSHQHDSIPLLSAAHAFSASIPATTKPAAAAVPRIIQGGMGVRISSWRLAREVARTGQLGVISGTAMDTILVRALQDGDPDGAMRRALATFPDQDMVQRILDKYFIEGGKSHDKPYRGLPMWSMTPPQPLLEAAVLANYCEVWLAKHDDEGNPINDKEEGWVGMNLLTKIQLPTIPSLYGAMLAGVDYILMGAGIPMQIPGILDALETHQDCHLPIDIVGKLPEDSDLSTTMTFSPSLFWSNANNVEMLQTLKLHRPKFLPIVSSVVLAQSMLKRGTGRGPTKGMDGFVVELNTAGGHNAPPRGFRYDAESKTHALSLNDRGEPIYGDKDDVDLLKFGKAIKGLPFWMAGSYGRPERFREVVEMGGTGVQVGTAFALSQESGMHDGTKQTILTRLSQEGGEELDVYTDPVASPTGFPFKVLGLDDTLAVQQDYENRPRVCNLGYLRTAYVKEDGKSLGYRCPSEPKDQYVNKGGSMAATEGRKCLCNALCADAGYPQVSPKKTKDGELYVEQPLVTIGDDVNNCRRFIKLDEATGRWGYSARNVVEYLLSEWEEASSSQKKDSETELKETVIKKALEDNNKKEESVVGTTVTKTKTKLSQDLKP